MKKNLILYLAVLRFDDTEYIDGIEYGIDAYVDLVSKETIAIFIKKTQNEGRRTDKAVSIKDEKILEIIKQFLKYRINRAYRY